MLRFRYHLLLIAALLPAAAAAQTVKFSGYIQAEGVYDTRQVLDIREGDFHLYPLRDSEVNRTDNLLMAAFRSRLRAAGSGLEAFGAKAAGFFEGDFIGTTNAAVSLLRIRHAYVHMDWGGYEVLAGQGWSPSFGVIFPNVIATNGGAPFQPFALLPQLQFVLKPQGARITAALTQQRDGASEIGGAKLQQQAARPQAHLHALLGSEKLRAGGGASYKWVRPVLGGDRFGAWAAQGYAQAVGGGFDLRAKLTYGYDLADHSMTGGFVTRAHSGAANDTSNPYEPLLTTAAWVDAGYAMGASGSVGLFAGYATNGGAEEAVAPQSVNARGAEIDGLWRLAPRIVRNSGPVRAAFELEATAARYTGAFDAQYKPVVGVADDWVRNYRFNVSLQYFF